MQWLQQNWLELFGVISALVYISLSIKQNIWLWPVGALTSALYIIVYFKTKFYADMGLQVYYLVISFYGWYIWLHPNKPGSKSMLPVAKIKWQWAFFLLVISVGLQIIIAWFLKNFTDSPVPWGDAFTTAFAITATWMLARKILEQWLVWIVVDLVSMILYVNKNMYLTAFLFLVYTIMAIIGYFEWKKEWKKIQPAPSL